MRAIEPGETCLVSRDIVIEGLVAFERGETVAVEKIVPNAVRPENKYVTLSQRLGIHYQLSDADIQLPGSVPPGAGTREEKPRKAVVVVIAALAAMVMMTVIGTGVVLALIHGGSTTVVRTGAHVCIDPGHGGSDTGALENGVAEKDVNLDIALRARSLLESRGYRVVMTRESDTAVSLAQRVAIANSSHASVLVSIHNNARPPDAAGTTTYFYRASSEGERLALDVQRGVVGSIGRPDRGIRRSNLYVVRNASMPAALLEGVFLTNAGDAALIVLPAFREKIAEGVATGIGEFLKSK